MWIFLFILIAQFWVDLSVLRCGRRCHSAGVLPRGGVHAADAPDAPAAGPAAEAVLPVPDEAAHAAGVLPRDGLRPALRVLRVVRPSNPPPATPVEGMTTNAVCLASAPPLTCVPVLLVCLPQARQAFALPGMGFFSGKVFPA